MTGFGLVFLPICLYFWRSPIRLLQLVLVGSVFPAAAAIVLGGFGIMPALVPASLFMLYFMLSLILGERFPAEKTVLSVLWPFMAVVAGAIVSSLLMPRLFEGAILVWPQKISSGIFVKQPLAPNSGNYTQDMYLLANAALAVTAAVYLTRPGLNLRRLLDTYFVSGLIAVAIALWQFANSVAHVPFPSTFFLSNPGWALLSTQTMGSLTRLNGTFSEPSSLAGYLCGSVSAAAWVIFNGDKARLPRAMLYSGLLVILLCTSATGYATLAIMAAILLVHSFLVAAPEIKRRVATGALIATVLAGFAVVTVPLIAPGVATEAQEIFGATVNKQQSDSYAARTTSDHDSMTAMYESYGLGVGWGSNRSSSLGPGLCASVGVWGIFGLLVFGALLLRHMRIARLLSADAGPRMVMHGCAAGLLGTLVATMLSGPTIASPDFYLLLALLIATGARVRHDARVAMFMQPPSRRLAPARFSTAQQMKGGSS
jgi:hypothetical protein